MSTALRKSSKSSPKKHAAVPLRQRPATPRTERYTTRRTAEFLLNNSVTAEDYAIARREVRRLGLDPDTIEHVPPKSR